MSEIKRYRRYKGWDYSKGASLFITIATAPRRALFGRVVGGKVALSPLGEKVMEAIEAMPRLNPGLSLFGRVVMPDHVHFNCCLRAGLNEPLKVLGGAIRRFKNYTTKLAKHSLAIRAFEERHSGRFGCRAEPDGLAVASGSPDGLVVASGSPDGQMVAGTSPDGWAVVGGSPDGQTVFGQLWQQGYHDYLLTSRKMIDSTERYIAYNPPKWELMHGAPATLRIREPLSSPRLDLGDYWNGGGNTALLGDDRKLLSLRVSRKVC